MISKKYFLIFSFNLTILYSYIYLFIGSFHFGDLDILIENYSFSKDALIGYKIVQNNNEFMLLQRLSFFNNSLIYRFIDTFFDIGNLFYTSILNSLIISYFFYKKRYSTYLIFLPVFIPFAVGVNKEIFLILAFYITIKFLCVSIQKKTILTYLYPFILLVLTRIYFLPLFFLTLLASKFKLNLIIIFYLLSSTVIALCISKFDFLSNLPYFFMNKQESFSYNFFNFIGLPFLNQLLYPVLNIFKLFYEPLFYFNPIKIYSFAQFYLLFLFLINWIYVIRSKDLLKIFIITVLFISLIPFVHFRYLLPPLVVIILMVKK
jgi:hypothetical protein